MKSFAEAKNACVVVAASGDELAGFCILHVERSRRRTVGYVVTLDVAPEQRRQELATKLMRAIERFALADECSALLLHVYQENAAAISFYERLGFVTLHAVEGFYGDGLDALVMHKPLG
jgi:ribosomal-protein-alanine N-acetyltransferase